MRTGSVFIDQPDSVRTYLAGQWGMSIQGDKVTAVICPLCQAFVPAEYNNAAEVGKTPRQDHEAFHVTMAEALSARTARA